MQNKILLLVVTILFLINIFIAGSSNTTDFFDDTTIKVKIDEENIDEIKLEEYIVGVVAAEMPASFQEEALKAQAVAARTYATYKMQNSKDNYDVVTTVSNQGYITIEEMQDKWKSDFNKYYEKIVNAVNATKGEVMYYNDEIVEAYYFAMSNGYTEKSELVFSESKDYLQSVELLDDQNNKNFSVTKEFNLSEFCEVLGITCEKIEINNIERSETNRVNYITVNNKEFKGTEFRKKLGLRSTDFTIEEKNNKVIITTKGYGHGVGMSQYGANSLAKSGYTYDEILKYFYKNVKIDVI